MPASQHSKVLSVRLPESELRRFKSLASSRGVSLQEAVHEAIEAWSTMPRDAQLEPWNALEGSLADVDTDKLLRAERESELAKDRSGL